MLVEDTRHSVQLELEPGEEIRRRCQPIPAAYARQAHVQFLFGVAFVVGFVILMCAIRPTGGPVSVSGRYSLAQYVPLILLYAGISMILSPWRLRRKARKIVYVITNRRAIILQGGGRGPVTAHSPGAIAEPSNGIAQGWDRGHHL